MINSTLLFPDTGPEFLKSLRLAALYSESVQVLTLTKQKTLLDAKEFAIQFKEFPGLIAGLLGGSAEPLVPTIDSAASTSQRSCRLEEFTAFGLNNLEELHLLESEGVLSSVSEEAFIALKTDAKAFASAMGPLSRAVESINQNKDEFTSICDRSRTKSPPSIDSFLAIIFELTVEMGRHQSMVTADSYRSIKSNPESIDQSAHAAYCLFLTYCAIRTGSAPMTWLPESQAVFNRCYEVFSLETDVNQAVATSRAIVSRQLGDRTFRELLPDVTTMPLEAVLDLRRRRNPELRRFRDALRELAVEIDPAGDARELARELDARVHAVIRPAVTELGAAVLDVQRKAYLRLFEFPQNLSEIGSVLVPVVFSQVSEQSVPVTLVAGATGGLLSVLSRLYEFVFKTRVEKQTLLDASPWSILWQLEKK